MGLYNILEADLVCPHCGIRARVEIEFKFGWMDVITYRLGDRIRWTGGGVRNPRVRPAGGDYVGGGYVECPNCGRDYWVTITVQDDVIANVEVDRSREGYVRERKDLQDALGE